MLFTSGLCVGERCGEFEKESCCSSIEGEQFISGEMFSFEVLKLIPLFISQLWS